MKTNNFCYLYIITLLKLVSTVQVIDADMWAKQMKNGECADLDARITVLELVAAVVVKSMLVIEEHRALTQDGRMPSFDSPYMEQ